jgi:hypothetical protein
MTDFRTEQAARNNAIWCDTICRAHGTPGEFSDRMWLNRHPVPPFYPNVVTLSDQRHAAAQHSHIQALMAAGLPGSWGVKDSFCTLDLTGLGFQILFEATWLWRAPSPLVPYHPDSQTEWSWVQSASELAAWETAWSGEPANVLSTPPPRLFLPTLLTEQEVAFVAGYQNGIIVAGAIANRTDDVVGLSNLFVPAENGTKFWAGCIAMVQERFPGLPLVGYEHGPELAAAQTVGFEPLQSLRVWTHQV